MQHRADSKRAPASHDLITDKEGTGAMKRNLTTGSVFKNVVLFSLPYLLSYFLQTLYGMADLFIIGQFEALPARLPFLSARR